MWRYKLKNDPAIHSLTLDGTRFTQEWQYTENRLYLSNDLIIEEEVDVLDTVKQTFPMSIVNPQIPDKEINKKQVEKELLISTIKELDITNVYDDFQLQHSSKSRLTVILNGLRGNK